MTEPFEWWSAESIALACACPLDNVQEHWPLIFEQMRLCGIQTPNVAIGVMGTTAIESASHFAPVKEGFYLGEPEPAESHRKTLDYYPFFGRGELQLTHENNYRTYGQKVETLWGAPPGSIDLVSNPDGALESSTAASIIALWFRDTRALPSVSYPQGYTLIQACEEQDWGWVRRLVYGGPDPEGAARIAGIQRDLGPPGGVAVAPPVVALPTYDWQYPAIAQNDNWSCAPTSTRWALSSWGRSPSEQWLENSMLAEGVVSTEHGLMNASGAELARWIDRHYGEFGYLGSNDGNVDFHDVVQEVAAHGYPLLLGGRGWYHWSGCRGFDGTKLLLANPAPGWKGVTQTMSFEQFEYLGPFSLVRVRHPGAEAAGALPDPIPPSPPDPDDPFAPWRGQVGSGILEAMAADNTLPAVRRSTWLPLGAPSPHDIEQATGQNGTSYVYLLTVGRLERYLPS